MIAIWRMATGVLTRNGVLPSTHKTHAAVIATAIRQVQRRRWSQGELLRHSWPRKFTSRHGKWSGHNCALMSTWRRARQRFRCHRNAVRFRDIQRISITRLRHLEFMRLTSQSMVRNARRPCGDRSRLPRIRYRRGDAAPGEPWHLHFAIGENDDTMAALVMPKEQGRHLRLSIVNVPPLPFHRKARPYCRRSRGPEDRRSPRQGVQLQVDGAGRASGGCAGRRGELSTRRGPKLVRLAGWKSRADGGPALAPSPQIEKLATRHRQSKDVLYSGRGRGTSDPAGSGRRAEVKENLPTSREGLCGANLTPTGDSL